MQYKIGIIDRITFVMWSFFSYLFFAWGTWMLLGLPFRREKGSTLR